MSWRQRASCRGVDPDLFYPERGESGREAKTVCRTCPVQSECLECALAAGSIGMFGIWGGTSENERKQLRRILRSAA